MSDFLACKVGVPQGSNLGNCQLVSNWMMGNKLKLNADKTHLMTVGTSARLKIQASKVIVEMDGFQLEESEDMFETLLGLQIEPNLKWHKQVEELLKKLGKRLTGLQNLRNIIPYHLRKRITEGMFTSILVYCLPVFGGCDKCEMEALQIMQNKEPEYLSSVMAKDNRADRIIVPNTNLTLAKNSYCYRAASQWNSLPEHIRRNNRIGQFKSQLKKWIPQNIAQFIDS